MYSFIRLMRSVPPARMSTSPQRDASWPRASSIFAGLEYAKACMLRVPPFQGREHPVGSERDARHPHTDGIGHRIGDRGRRAHRRRLAQTDNAALVMFLGDVEMHHHLADVA